MLQTIQSKQQVVGLSCDLSMYANESFPLFIASFLIEKVLPI